METLTAQPIIAVGGVVYRRTRRGRIEVLLIKKRGGLWTFPKGHVEPGENDIMAVAREVSEETGIAGTVEANVRQVAYPIVKQGQTRLKIVTYYLLRATAGHIRLPSYERIR